MISAVLYTSYDNMLEPLCQSQVLADLNLLATFRRFHLIGFEKPENLDNIAYRERIKQDIAGAIVGGTHRAITNDLWQ